MRVRASLAGLVVAIAATLAGAANAQTSSVTANVRDYGAVGNGVTDDSAAIQRADNYVAGQGGGTVYFPAGTYKAVNVKQDNNVALVGTSGAVLKHPDGVNKNAIVSGRVTKTAGTVVEGSNRVRVKVATRFVPGAVVGVTAAGGGSDVQWGNLSWPILAGMGSVVFQDTKGWPRAGLTYILIEDEIISYNGINGNTAQNVHRGVLGSTAIGHAKGQRISLLQTLFAKVTSVNGLDVYLDRPAVQAVAGSYVNVGSINLTVRDLTLDGNKRAAGSASTNPMPLMYNLARYVTIQNNTIVRGDHGAVSFDEGTADSTISGNTLTDNGTPSAKLGSAIWLFRSSGGNVVQDNTINGDSYLGITVDDRSESATGSDGPSNSNVIFRNHIDIPASDANAAILVAGSDDTEVAENVVSNAESGIAVLASTQGYRPADSERTVTHDNQLNSHQLGLWVTGSYNTFERNAMTEVVRDVFDAGQGNSYA